MSQKWKYENTISEKAKVCFRGQVETEKRWSKKKSKKTFDAGCVLPAVAVGAACCGAEGWSAG